ncbi:hypothetical protein PICMEDRAFT_9078 [Pichia membranifaciens NRRL Y-2026]|uniref:Uncharacterized protein n=1 Tax=Pichia membranifaciens NRRL Y-2026 TaxID=763406 RepID=A0A1E3NR30_9ASCO|nr:hypothetical protein PICMEDRAFT_9078 [Pichia membranifaciens NRRL Y-2026]ODQ48542.1 hypothetical protein PICMEDRAFT_9078 [Pichia membranifaciens NRRL Y-2026]
MNTGDGEKTQLDPLPVKGQIEQCTKGQNWSASLEESPFEYQCAEIDHIVSVRAAIKEGLDLKHGGSINSWESSNYNNNTNYNSGSNYSLNYRNYEYNNGHTNITGNSSNYGVNYDNGNMGSGNHLMYKYNNNNSNNYNNRQNNRQNSKGNYKNKNKRMNQAQNSNQTLNQVNNNANSTNYNGQRRYKNFNSFPDQQQLDQQNMLYNSMVGMNQTMDTSVLNGGLSLGASPGNLLQQLQQQQQQQQQLHFMNKGLQNPQVEAGTQEQGQNTHLLESFLFQQLSSQNQVQSPSCKHVQNPLETQLQSLGNTGGSMDSIFARGTGFSNISNNEISNTSSLLPKLNTTSQQQQPIHRTTTDSHLTSYSNSTSNSNSVSAPNSASNNESSSSSSNYSFQPSQLKPFKFDSLSPFNFQSLMDQPEISTPGSTITRAGSSLASLGSSIPSSSTNRENSLSFMSDMLDSNGTSTNMNLSNLSNTTGLSSTMTMVDPLESIWKRGHNTNSTISNSSNLVSTPGENGSKASDDFGMGTYVGNLNVADGNRLEDIGLFGSYFS